jgi:3-oxoadipate enol-lactonase
MNSPWTTGTCAVEEQGALHYRWRNMPGSATGGLVLIHSLGLDCSLWNETLALLPSSMPVLVYDCRGHGRSRASAGNYTVELFARDLVTLLDHVGWRQATVAGCSLGGCVGLAFAKLFPQRVRALGLIDTTAWYGPEAAATWSARAADALQRGMATLAGGQAERWFGVEFRDSASERVAELLNCFSNTDVHAFAASCRMLGSVDLRAALPAIRVPTSVIVGECDAVTPPDVSRRLSEVMPDARLHILPGAGHLSPVEAPAIVSALLAALAGSVASSSLPGPE